jgi:HAD superfamily phosphoserine phosphatase-like hydrolase
VIGSMTQPVEMVVASDLEGTLTTGETWKALGRYLRAHGRGRAYTTFFLLRLPGALAAKAGMIDMSAFRDRWMRDLARQFAGLTEQDWSRIAEWVTEQELWPKRREPVVEELRRHQAEGRRVVIASASYQPVLDAFARRIGADAIGTQLEIVGGRMTGRIVPPINSGMAKADRLRAWSGNAALHAAYGDTPPDIFMLDLAEAAVVVNPGPVLRRTALERGWRVLLP